MTWLVMSISSIRRFITLFLLLFIEIEIYYISNFYWYTAVPGHFWNICLNWGMWIWAERRHRRSTKQRSRHRFSAFIRWAQGGDRFTQLTPFQFNMSIYLRPKPRQNVTVTVTVSISEFHLWHFVLTLSWGKTAVFQRVSREKNSLWPRCCWNLNVVFSLVVTSYGLSRLYITVHTFFDIVDR